MLLLCQLASRYKAPQEVLPAGQAGYSLERRVGQAGWQAALALVSALS